MQVDRMIQVWQKGVANIKKIKSLLLKHKNMFSIR